MKFTKFLTIVFIVVYISSFPSIISGKNLQTRLGISPKKEIFDGFVEAIDFDVKIPSTDNTYPCIYTYSCNGNNVYVGQAAKCKKRIGQHVSNMHDFMYLNKVYGKNLLLTLQTVNRGDFFDHDACIVGSCHGHAISLSVQSMKRTKWLASSGDEIKTMLDHSEKYNIAAKNTKNSGCNRTNGNGDNNDNSVETHFEGGIVTEAKFSYKTVDTFTCTKD